MEEDGEFGRLMKMCFTVFACLIYCYFISKNIPKGFLRLMSVLPIICIFTFLPLNLSSLHLTFYAGFLIGWLANFKLLLFSFDMGPLSSPSLYLSMTLPLFISLACLPLKIKQNPSSSLDNNRNTKSSSSKHKITHITGKEPKSSILYYYVVEGLLLALVLCVFKYKQQLHYPSITMKFLYFYLTYFTLEILLAFGAALAWILFGLESEPQFNSPLVSTSYHNFWGRRWNLVVSSILRSIVYTPVRHICSRSSSSSRWIIGESLGPYIAVVATFIVSGVMHELLLFYMGRIRPVWDVMWFFVLSGIFMAMEIAAKKALKGTRRWQLNNIHHRRLVSNMLTFAFLVVTSFWLLYPAYERIGVDIRVNQEIATFTKLIKDRYAW